MSFNLGKSLHPAQPLGVTINDDTARITTQAVHPFSLELSGGGLSEYLTIWGHDMNLLSTGMQKIASDLGLEFINVVSMLPAHSLKRQLIKINRELTSVMLEDQHEWWRIFTANRDFLDSLQPFRVTAQDNLRSEKAMSLWDRYAQLGDDINVDYSMCSTITGRLIVSSGPSVLTATPEERKRWICPNGVPLWEIDLSALEPTILFRSQIPDFDPGDDLYSTVNKLWFNAEMPRDVVKQVTISLCYGASTRSLVSIGATPEQVKQLVDDLKLKHLAKQLREELNDTGRITSPTGRPIKPKSNNPRSGALINNIIQSSGVDVSLSIFHKMCGLTGYIPRAIVHDAMYVSGIQEVPDNLRIECDILKGKTFRFTAKSVIDD